MTTSWRPGAAGYVPMPVYVNLFGVAAGGNEVIIDFGTRLPRPGSVSKEEGQPALTDEAHVRVIMSRVGGEKLRDLLTDMLTRTAPESGPST